MTPEACEFFVQAYLEVRVRVGADVPRVVCVDVGIGVRPERDPAGAVEHFDLRGLAAVVVVPDVVLQRDADRVGQHRVDHW